MARLVHFHPPTHVIRRRPLRIVTPLCEVAASVGRKILNNYVVSIDQTHFADLASWRRLGPDVRSKRDLNGGIPSWMAFFKRFLSDLPSENQSRNLEKSLNSVGKILFLAFRLF